MQQQVRHRRSVLQRTDGAAAARSPARAPAVSSAASPRSGKHHLVHVFPSFDIGGAQVRFTMLTTGLGEAFSHTIVSLSGRFGAASLLRPDADVRLMPPWLAAGPLPQRLLAYRRTVSALRPDLLVTYNWGAIEVACANRIGGVPHLHMEDGFGPDEVAGQVPRRVLMRRLLLRSSQVIVPSSGLHRIAIDSWRLDPARVHHIPNGVAPKFGFDTPLASLGLGLDVDRPKVIWAGGLRAEKNPLRLLRAFAPLKDRASLLIVGEGPQRGAITELIRELELGDSVHLLGQRTDTRDLIMQCDVLALSSDTEQMPLVVLEAMDAGLAIASVDVGDVANMVAGENQPFVVERTDLALTQALDRLIDDRALRLRLGLANRERARQAYSLAEMTRAHRAVITSAMALKGRAR